MAEGEKSAMKRKENDNEEGGERCSLAAAINSMPLVSAGVESEN